MAEGVEAAATRAAGHLAELQRIEEDVVPCKSDTAAGHVDAIRQRACSTASHTKHMTSSKTLVFISHRHDILGS